jgi:hypothetical protein
VIVLRVHAWNRLTAYDSDSEKSRHALCALCNLKMTEQILTYLIPTTDSILVCYLSESPRPVWILILGYKIPCKHQAVVLILCRERSFGRVRKDVCTVGESRRRRLNIVHSHWFNFWFNFNVQR